MRAGVVQLLAATAALWVAPGCSLLTSFDEGRLSEDTYERCKDSADNDGDSLLDCDDPGCAPFDSLCGELTPEFCSDGTDNDGDGHVDCKDPGCVALPGVCVEKTAAACSDGKDNDEDQLIDCRDPDCKKVDVCQETGAADCADGKDNDNDGLTDCNDFDCYNHTGCCTLKATAFSGDSFSYKSASCSQHLCSKNEPSCCTSGYETCSNFDPEKWVAWGLPRARLEGGAFAANEPCGCEPSGLVSTEFVPLAAGLKLTFDLTIKTIIAPPNHVCAGLTIDSTFPDDHLQCAGGEQPRLLAGICLEVQQVGTQYKTQLSAVVDGEVQESATASGGAPIKGSIDLAADGVHLTAGPLKHKTAPFDKGLQWALVLIHGSGTSATLDNLKITQPAATTKSRCQAPDIWYRHLGRGEPVVGATDTLLDIGHPAVVQRQTSKSSYYLMIFEGRPKASETAYPGFYAATSADGISWEVSDKPVIPASKSDGSFGTQQYSPSLLYWKNQYHLWYTREETVATHTQRGIAHATSSDGKTWKHSPGSAGGSFVFEAGVSDAWDAKSVASPTVVISPDGNLLMWYTGTEVEIGASPSIGVASSKDGTSWTRLQPFQPVIQPSTGSSDLGCEDPAVVYDPKLKLYRMWYTHRAFGRYPAIHYAVSLNGIGWIHWSEGAAMESGRLGTFDERGVLAPAVIRESDRVRLWFTGIDNKGTRQVGYAENRGSLP